jgi:predicted DNA-binding protein
MGYRKNEPTKGRVKLTPEGRSIMLTARISDTDSTELKALSRIKNRPVSVLVRDAIKYYLYELED